MRWPKWLRDLPVWETLRPMMTIATVMGAAGFITLLAGIFTGDWGYIAGGSMALVPFLFLWFLLWRSAADDPWIKE